MKIGDKVRIISNKEDVPLDYRGAEGIITSIGKVCWVRLDDISENRWFDEDELEVIKCL